MDREIREATVKVVSSMTNHEVIDSIIGQCRFLNELEAKVVLMELNHLRIYMVSTISIAISHRHHSG